LPVGFVRIEGQLGADPVLRSPLIGPPLRQRRDDAGCPDRTADRGRIAATRRSPWTNRTPRPGGGPPPVRRP